MIHFDPSGNNIKDEGAYFLSSCLKNIKELRLIQCNITEKGIKHLSAEIARLDEPARWCFLFLYNCACYYDKIFKTLIALCQRWKTFLLLETTFILAVTMDAE